MVKKTLWMLIANQDRPDIHLIIPSIAWMADDAGVVLECYLESQREGLLFARSGSTVIGGHHHQQFNYIHAAFDVRHILIGDTAVFRSSLAVFNCATLVDSDDVAEVYTVLLNQPGVSQAKAVIVGPDKTVLTGTNMREIGPYVYPDIYYRRALAFPVTAAAEADTFSHQLKIPHVLTLYLDRIQLVGINRHIHAYQQIDKLNEQDTYASMTLRIASRWKHMAKGVAFADPMAILSQMATLCRDDKIAVYEEKQRMRQSDVIVNAYSEEKTRIAADVIQLCAEIGNRVIVGRQTGDGDLFEWSKGGVCIQIMDPNRPAFPAVSTVNHPWTRQDTSLYDSEPDDKVLHQYAEEGKILAALVFHSGEMAHNEAMINLLELSALTGLKMGIGVHAARYETCPQIWELINIPLHQGGLQGQIEPIIHAGGMGVMAEINCPPHFLQEHCQNAMQKIHALVGEKSMPKGYYAFADTDLDTHLTVKSGIYQAIEESGLSYFISSVKPGRNRIIYESDRLIVFNQTSKTFCTGSPFVRITSIEDIHESGYRMKPGWFIGTLDAPVISFNAYIWRHGSRFMKIADWLKNTPDVVNVLPHTISRYIRILKARGLIRSPIVDPCIR